MLTLTLSKQQIATLFHAIEGIRASPDAMNHAADQAAKLDKIDSETFNKLVAELSHLLAVTILGD